MTHDELKELAAAYVLDALDRDERRAFEIHLAGCAECAADVRSLRRVTDGLAWAAPLRTPSPEVRDRVLTAVTGSAPHQPREPIGDGRARGAGSRTHRPGGPDGRAAGARAR